MSRTIHELESFDTFDDILRTVLDNANNRPSIVMASATWCGPCKQLKSQVVDRTKLSDKLFNSAVWYVMDIDLNAKEVQNELGIRSVPHVLWIEPTGQVEHVRGNHLSTLKRNLGSS